MSNIQLNVLNISWCNGGLTEKAFYGTSRALTSLTENYIMEGVRSPSPEIYDYYLKKKLPNLLSNTSLDFTSDRE